MMKKHLNDNPSPSTDNSTSTTSSTCPIQVRLPAIDLPSFHGKYEDWLSFADTFKALIHSNESLSDVQKLHYLKSALKSEAAQVIQSLELTSSNYEVAWNLVEDRYKNKKIIVQKHVKALFNLPSVDKDSGQGIRRLLDGSLKHIRALKALDQPTDTWDTLLVHLITSRFNQELQREWELASHPSELPKFSELADFMQVRCQVLENASSNRSNQRNSTIPSKPKITTHKTCFMVQNSNCRLCNGKHPIFRCQSLLDSNHSDREQMIKKAGVCFNCLKPGHMVNDCQSRGCRICSKKHNTALHIANKNPSDIKTATNEHTNKINTSIVTGHTYFSIKGPTQVLLSTALVEVVSPSGRTVKCRALLDNGSQSCFMTENIVQFLGLRKSRNSCQVSGINGSSISMNGSVTATIKSCVSNYIINLSFLTVPSITGNLPSQEVNIESFKFPSHIALADPTFNSPGRIDLLIGQEIFWDLLCIGQLKSHGLPTLQKTRLGWVVGGRFNNEATEQDSNISCHLSTTEKISSQLQAFWQIEEPTQKKHLTKEETSCEDHFNNNTTRDSTGRYIVQMPLQEDANVLGDSRETAMKRFLQVEKRLTRDKNMAEQYKTFMDEYLQLGHMEEVHEDEHNQNTPKNPEYFLPHHPVVKTSSSTTKLRVVFDASAKTTTGKSLNDIQSVGPTVQSDLISILLRFRTFTYAISADIEKMYRQVSINPSQTNLLKIFWRNDTTQPIKPFRLKTVTYGTASAPYLATRVLNQLAVDEGKEFPEASEIIQRDFYVDDLLTGTNNIDNGLALQKQLIDILARGNFNLRKWNSNSNELLSHLPEALLEKKPQEFPLGGDSSTAKTLGIWWDAEEDNFQFKYSPCSSQNQHKVTKRAILSEVAKLFDPLGIVAPIVVRAKMHLQELWKLNLGWDESIPMNLYTQWTRLKNCLAELNHLHIERQVTIPHSEEPFEIHGFSDASEQAYGAAVYIRQTNCNEIIKCKLLCAKSRVAPLQSTSLPRLELCAALLLSELVAHVKKALHITPKSTTYWTDSTIVLAWINNEPARWTTFVANRVSKIQDLTNEGAWRHVRTQENPADLVSRGASTQDLREHTLWWNGPDWLSTTNKEWPSSDLQTPCDIPERRTPRTSTFVATHSKMQNDTVKNLCQRFSSYNKIIRVTAYCIRFITNCKQTKNSRHTGPLTTEELRRSRTIIVKFVQQESFPKEIHDLTKGVPSKKINSLAPFLDESGLIRVGGRVERSNLSYDSRHPVLLPKNHYVVELIAKEEHVRQLHCGPQALLYSLRQYYWPINGRLLARSIVHKCTTCFRVKPKPSEQLMGVLPANRVTPARPFLQCGVDYCGPFFTKQSRNRNSRTSKSYVAVFICLATKAVHLELVSDLTADTFLGALKRFISRRGIPSTITSDNGGNFVRANRELQDLRRLFKEEASTIVTGASLEGINWRFNPPYAPHMGGLWEAAVKSLKHHLKRVVGSTALPFEELVTVLTQVEAVMNSRPLTPMSNDPSDLSVLTPAHFLTGGSLRTVPEPSLQQLPENRLSRWQRVQQLTEHFWRRWAKEYLNNLQQRRKWTAPKPALAEGSLVILREDNTPPLSWPLGRVLHLHPGQDGLTRVATIKTMSGVVKRSINKLCVLPIVK